ncbi:MAG TPA: hypothetical protein VGO90_17600 [Chthoniobacteraceae bacterium]|jgi:hypothetical protein|nr:hypothetical protein [Chthoniobacteraceae bacterium]
MRPLVFLAACLLGVGLCRGQSADELQAVQRADLDWTIAWEALNVASVNVVNSSATPLKIEQPAGAIYSGEGVRLVSLKAWSVEVPARGSATVKVPIAALTWRSLTVPKAFVWTDQKEPRIEPLLAYLAKRPDVSSVAAQLAVLCFTEDIGFASWQQFLAAQRAARGEGTAPPPTDIVAAIEVLEILRELAPKQPFALASDGELKLRALRNPWCRAKAVELYGLTAPGAPALAPELSTLLHARTGDNCPICRPSGPPPDNGF